MNWREHGPDGWSGWREAYFALTTADHRMLTRPEPVLDPRTRGALLDTVMDEIAGESLRERLTRGGRLDIGETARIVKDLAAALDAALEVGDRAAHHPGGQPPKAAKDL